MYPEWLGELAIGMAQTAKGSITPRQRRWSAGDQCIPKASSGGTPPLSRPRRDEL